MAQPATEEERARLIAYYEMVLKITASPDRLKRARRRIERLKALKLPERRNW